MLQYAVNTINFERCRTVRNITSSGPMIFFLHWNDFSLITLSLENLVGNIVSLDSLNILNKRTTTTVLVHFRKNPHHIIVENFVMKIWSNILFDSDHFRMLTLIYVLLFSWVFSEINLKIYDLNGGSKTWCSKSHLKKLQNCNFVQTKCRIQETTGLMFLT